MNRYQACVVAHCIRVSEFFESTDINRGDGKDEARIKELVNRVRSFLPCETKETVMAEVDEIRQDRVQHPEIYDEMNATGLRIANMLIERQLYYDVTDDEEDD